MAGKHSHLTRKKKLPLSPRGRKTRKYALGWPSPDEAHWLLKHGTWQCVATFRTAKAAGYLSGAKSERVGGRVSSRLISAAMAKSGIDSQTELLEYALSKVALEDDFGKKLLARKGSVPDDVAL